MFCRIEFIDSHDKEPYKVIYLHDEIVLDKEQPLIILCDKSVNDLFIDYWANYFNPNQYLDKVRNPEQYKQLMKIEDIDHHFYDELTTQQLILLTQPANQNNMSIFLKELLIVISYRFSEMSIKDTARYFNVDYKQNNKHNKKLKIYKEIKDQPILFDVIVNRST